MKRSNEAVRTAFGVLLACCAAAGCQGESADAGAPRVSMGAHGDAEVGGQVVSTVNGHPIRLDEVENAARAAQVEPRVALRRLQDEALLASAAAHEGFEEDAEVERAARQAMVQTLLARTIEREVTVDDVDPARIEAEYAASQARWAQPERRASVHVFARVPSGAEPRVVEAAEGWARETHTTVAASDDPTAAILALRRRPPGQRPFDVTVEEVAPLARTDAADPRYLDAIFGVDDEGLLPDPVLTALGWHVVALTEIQARQHTERQEALRILQDERLAALRAAALEEQLRAIVARTVVEVERDSVVRFLDDASLWSESR